MNAGLADVVPVPRGRSATAGIVAAYLALFFGLLPALLWALGHQIDVLLALPAVSADGWTAAGVLLTTSGAVWMIWSMALLRLVGGGWPVSHLPPSRLVTTGTYALSRHPIYLGYLALSAGLALLSGSLGRLITAGLLAIGMVDYVLALERPALRRRFTGSYDGYEPGSRSLGKFLRPAWMAVRGPIEWLANKPVLARIGPTVWVTYGLFVALGCAASASVLADRLATDGLAVRTIVGYAAIVAPAMAVGGRLLWFATAYRQVRMMGLGRAVRTVGLVSWGTYLGFFAGSAIFAAAWKVSLPWLLDRTVPVVLLCSVIGRIGCLTYGCCFGRVCADGIVWRRPESKVVRQFGAAAGQPRIPVQLMSAAATLTAVLAAALASLRPAPAGVVTGLVMLLYAMGRFGVDSFRDQTFELAWARGLNLGQVSSLLVIVLALAMLFAAHGPSAWPRSMFAYDWPLLSPMAPLIAIVTALIFVVSGYHWRRVGQW